jgi:hypothetical protein
MKTGDLAPALRDKMKKIFNEVHKAVLACEDKDGRKRCELFRELPDKRVSRRCSVPCHTDTLMMRSGLSGLLPIDYTAHRLVCTS